MVFAYFDRVKETSTTTGTGTVSLSGVAPGGFRRFSSVYSNGDTMYYCIVDQNGNDWEVGLGTYSADTLARTSVTASSNGGSAVNFTSGSLYVFTPIPAAALPGKSTKFVTPDSTDTFTNKTFDTAGTGNSFSINGVAASANTGTGAVVRATAPTINQPNTVGTTTNNNAAAGSVGEYIVSDIASGSAVSLVTATAKTVTSISLTPGDWDVNGLVSYSPGGATITSLIYAAISTVTDTLPGTSSSTGSNGIFLNLPAGQSASIPTGEVRVSLSSTITIYLIAYSSFTISTNAAWGYIRARRIR